MKPSNSKAPQRVRRKIHAPHGYQKLSLPRAVANQEKRPMRGMLDGNNLDPARGRKNPRSWIVYGGDRQRRHEPTGIATTPSFALP